ncbi:hypothetical protein Avbf_02967 [Armadillidium vulgare]|nr:hypothetical protein Avbf_02967 [Armadillidium vulgare]
MALSTPGDTLELMKHKIYMQKVMQDQMPTLQERVYILHGQLQERREQFKEELAEYGDQLEEFQEFGDVNLLNEYLRKARSLHEALNRAAACIDHINKEEEALSWSTTHYPTRKQVTITYLVLNQYLTTFKPLMFRSNASFI